VHLANDTLLFANSPSHNKFTLFEYGVSNQRT